MLSIARNVPGRISRPLTRTFAEVVNAPVPAEEAKSKASSLLSKYRPASRNHTKVKKYDQKAPSPPGGKVPVREDHGLYAFFRRKPDADLSGEAAYEVVETPEEQQILSGRAWEASELRLKSFEDLHTLWYVTLRERNLLATQREEARRLGTQMGYQVSQQKMAACRKTMARIKAVMNERRLAYLGAVELAKQDVEDYHDKVVLQELRKQQKHLETKRQHPHRRAKA